MLCEDGVLIPRAYRAMKNGTLETSKGFKFPTDWVGKCEDDFRKSSVLRTHGVT